MAQELLENLNGSRSEVLHEEGVEHVGFQGGEDFDPSFQFLVVEILLQAGVHDFQVGPLQLFKLLLLDVPLHCLRYIQRVPV